MIKCWLIKTMAPYYGTEQYYVAFAEDNPYDSGKIDEWFDEECQHLWDSYSFRLYDDWDKEWEECKEEFCNDYDDFLDMKYEEWCQDCNIECEECSEEDLKDYVSGGKRNLEIIYDERVKND